MNDTELRDIENPTWDLLVEVMALGERIGLDSTKLADYHTQLLSLIANHSASVEREAEAITVQVLTNIMSNRNIHEKVTNGHIHVKDVDHEYWKLTGESLL